MEGLGDSDTPGIDSEVLSAILVKVVILKKSGNPSAGVAVCNRMMERHGNSTQKDARYRLAHAWVTKGQCLDDMGDCAAVIRTYEEVLDRFDDTEDNAWHVAEAMVNKAKLLDRPEEADQAGGICEEVDRRLVDFDTGEFRKSVVTAAFLKAMLMSKTEDSDRYPDLVREFVRRFQDSTDPQVQRLIQAMSLVEVQGFPRPT